MKLLRLALLLVLAVLLPVRSGLAAAMLCPTGGVMAAGAAADPAHPVPDTRPAPQAQALDQAHDARQAQDAHHAHHVHHVHHAGHADLASPVDEDPAGTADLQQKCTLCAAFCSMTPVPATPVATLPPHDAAATPFPALSAPPPHFATGGLERPPRAG